MHRHNSPRSTRHGAQGATLVSLMVGLTLSMLVVAAMMLVFRNLSLTTGGALKDAQYDDSLTAGLLSSGLAFHEAGFGVPQAALGTHLLVIHGASATRIKKDEKSPPTYQLQGTAVTSGGERSGNLVVWQQVIDTKSQCSGLLAPPEGGLMRLPPIDCNNPGEWATLVWPGKDITRANASVITIAVTELAGTSSCAPFGISAGQGHLRITLSAPNSNGVTLTVSECLNNFPAPASSKST